MNEKNQQYKGIADSCIRAIEEGFRLYSQAQLYNASTLKIPAMEYLNEIFDWGRVNLDDFDRMHVNIDGQIITVETLDHKLSNDGFIDMVELSKYAREAHYAN